MNLNTTHKIINGDSRLMTEISDKSVHSDGEKNDKISSENLKELGERLYEKISEVLIPKWKEALNNLTKSDCEKFIYNLINNRPFYGYLREKSVINDGLAKIFPEIKFEESTAELDHAGDIDYIGYVTENLAFGIQIKPVTAKSNFGNYSVSERMKSGFQNFTDEFGGKVFIVFSLDKEINNKEVISEIEKEIFRLRNL